MSAAMAASELYTKVKKQQQQLHVCLCVILGYLLVACRLLESARVAAFLASPAINVVTCSEKTNGCGGVGLEMAHSPGNSTFKHVFVAEKLGKC